MSLFEKIKLENKDNVSNLRKQFSKNEISTYDIPHDVLVQLFFNAISRIDKLENACEDDCEFDERDWKDTLCDQNAIVDELFERLEANIKFGIYE